MGHWSHRWLNPLTCSSECAAGCGAQLEEVDTGLCLQGTPLTGASALGFASAVKQRALLQAAELPALEAASHRLNPLKP